MGQEHCERQQLYTRITGLQAFSFSTETLHTTLSLPSEVLAVLFHVQSMDKLMQATETKC